MANIQERRNKEGKIVSYSVRVHRGYDSNGKQLKPWTATFEVQPTWSEKTARKKAEAFAAVFEQECKSGIKTDSRQKFEPYCNYVLELKESRGVKHSTIVRYKELATRIYPVIGHIKLSDLRADHLNSLYTALSKTGVRKNTSKAKVVVDLAQHIKDHGLSKETVAKKGRYSALYNYFRNKRKYSSSYYGQSSCRCTRA